ncbi:MAG TPA: hypothetical protein VE133_12070 [Candidatus Sulfotelmatobacter sp.]|nr:hypothetical protein [Candidatus Sulfotelmatobacter sp.]
MGRKLLAGVLGGLAFFLWSFVAHMFLGLGEVGIQEIPNEQAVVSTMKANIPASGLYLFPGWGLPPDATHSQKMAVLKSDPMQARIKAGPTGIVVFRAGAGEMIAPRQLITELLTNIIQILLAVILLGQTRIINFVGRWRFITIAGVLAAISTNISYWNWFGFPGNYTLAYICTIAMGFVFAGLVAAAIFKPVVVTSVAAA